MKHRDKIIELRAQGKSYREIQQELGCSKGTIAYHCGPGQKQKTRERNQQAHPFTAKSWRFQQKSKRQSSKRPPLQSIRVRVWKKVYFFQGEVQPMQFTVDDVIKKFGETPTCYLTGQSIDIWQPSTYEFDHIIPRTRGGTNDFDNLGICLKSANRAKCNMTPDEFVNLCRQVVSMGDRSRTCTGN